MQLDNFNQIIGAGINIYGSRERIRAQIISYAQDYLQLKNLDFYKTSVLSYIIDMLSILSANQLFYDSMIYREFFMVDAQMQESVYNLARWIGYEVPKATPATVDLMFTFPLTFPGNEIQFNIQNTFQAYSGSIIYTIQSVSDKVPASEFRFNKTNFVPATAAGRIVNNSAITVKDSNGYYRPVFISSDGQNASFTLPFIQKQKKVIQFFIPSTIQPYQFISQILEYSGMTASINVYVAEAPAGEKINLESQIKSLPNQSLQNFDPNIDVYTNSGKVVPWNEWSESPNGVYTMDAGDPSFVLVSGPNKGELFFGNGIIGKQPPPNSVVTVVMYLTLGSNGKVIPNTVVRGDEIYYAVSPVYSQTGEVVGSDLTSKLLTVGYSITNPTQSSGGEDIPTLPAIKRNAIINLRSKQRLVSDLDYDDINVILGATFPAVEAYPILKRSDIKINEIMAFIRLMYHDEYSAPQIVPTRNAKIYVYDPVLTDSRYTILRTSKVLINDEYYETLFNITIDDRTRMAYYDYILQNIVGTPVNLYQEEPYSWYQQYTYIPINTVDFNIDIPELVTGSSSSSAPSQNAVYPLKVKVNVNHIPSDNPEDYQFRPPDGVTRGTEIRCRMITKWDDNQEYDQVSVKWELDPNTNPEQTKFSWFEFEIPNYLNVPTDLQRFEFNIEGWGLLRNKSGQFVNANGDLIGTGDDPDIAVEGWIPIAKYYVDIVVRKDMTDTMVSTVTKTSYWNGTPHLDSVRYEVHNVPVILTDYYEKILARSDNSQYPNFEVTVMQNLINNLNVINKKMLTDFIAIKFPDTYGKLNNLKYNPVDYIVESRFHTPFKYENPEDIIFVSESETSSSSSGTSPDVIERYIVNGEVPNYKDHYDLASYIDNIAELYKAAGPNGEDIWYLIKPRRGMYVRVKDELDEFDDKKVIVYDGDKWKDAQDFQIPVRIRLQIQMDPTATISDAQLKTNIQTALVDYFSPLMGTQKNLDRSEISGVVRSVTGVKFCEVLSPEVDIQFKYELKDLTEKQLIDYTPQYVGFIADSIEINILT